MVVKKKPARTSDSSAINGKHYISTHYGESNYTIICKKDAHAIKIDHRKTEAERAFA
jgi:hypothetical protein